MSSDSELGGPSPLPSPIFARCSPARGTVARKCREFYLKRLERTASMQKRWSICDVPQNGLQEFGLPTEKSEKSKEESRVETQRPEDISSDGTRVGINKTCDNFDGFPLRKCRSSFDIAMDSLRREISSLIAQDNDLFRQLLSLHDSIAELRERQRHSALYMDDDDEEEDVDLDLSHQVRHSSLESLSDPGGTPETSPESTLSSRSSLSDCKHGCHGNRKLTGSKQRSRKEVSRPITFIDKSEICFRCRKLAPPYRRSSSITSLYYLHEDLESYDSGIHLHGSHSDSDHEIFV